MFVAIVHRIAWLPLRFLFWLLADFRVFGTGHVRNIPAPAIFVSNHHGRFDPFLIGIALPWMSPLHAVNWLTRDDEFARPIRRHTIRLFGAFPGKIRRGYEEVLAKPLALLARSKSVGVFPEWCYEGDAAALDRMQHVAPLLAEKTGRPVIPVFLYGVGRVSWWRLFRRRLAIRVTFGAPYDPRDEPSDEILGAVNRALLQTRLDYLQRLHEEERRFWEDYGAFYAYLERADAYQELIADFASLLPQRIEGTWVDLGSGSGIVAELLKRRAAPGATVIATDHASVMIEQLRKRFGPGADVRAADLARELPFAENSLDGVTANLVLPYIIHHRGTVGTAALMELLSEIRRVLRPGGVLVWSTPKAGVRFAVTFVKSLPSMLRADQRENLVYGPRILAQAMKIQAKGRRGVYHFLSRSRLREAMKTAGFRDVRTERSMARQVELVRGEKA